MTYAGKVTVDTCALHSGVRELTESLNGTMAGFTEKISVRSEIGVFSIASEAVMTWQQLEEVRAKAESVMREKSPEWGWRVGQLVGVP